MEDIPKENVSEQSETLADAQPEKTELSSTPEKRLSVEPAALPLGIQGTKKIDILLKATGDAPIMKQKKWAVEADRKISYVISFVKKYLKMDATESLFIYVNQAFAPSPDQILRNLFECFGTDGKLVLHYCKSQAWG